MKPPQTINEFYEMMKAFTQKDPDKNGKDDTFGLIETDAMSLFGQLKYWFGAPNKWAVKEGKLVPDFMTPEYKAAMDFLRKAYQEKLINPDFAVTGQNQMLDYINKGRGGGYAGAYAQFSNGWLTPLQRANPDAKLDFLYKIKSPNGQFRKVAAGGYNGVFMFPKSSVKSEEQLRRILSFFDMVADDTMRKLISMGIEGRHYKMETGNPVIINPQQFTDEIIPLRWIMVADGITDRIAVGFSELDQRITAAQKDKSIVYVPDPAYPFTSKLIVDEKIVDDARAKYIMGELDESGWKAAIEKWRTNRGDQLTAEFQKQYDVVIQENKK
jgi:putative aldouronate transport system substrate-binding protein